MELEGFLGMGKSPWLISQHPSQPKASLLQSHTELADFPPLSTEAFRVPCCHMHLEFVPSVAGHGLAVGVSYSLFTCLSLERQGLF